MSPGVTDVLIVDDDPDIREMLAYTLSVHGIATRQAGGAEQALQLLRAEPPACIVLDLMMPGADGFDFLAQRREESVAPDAKVLVLSCRGDEAALVRAWELGADGFLVKPTDPDLLVARIKELAAAHVATGS